MVCWFLVDLGIVDNSGYAKGDLESPSVFESPISYLVALLVSMCWLGGILYVSNGQVVLLLSQ